MKRYNVCKLAFLLNSKIPESHQARNDNSFHLKIEIRMLYKTEQRQYLVDVKQVMMLVIAMVVIAGLSLFDSDDSLVSQYRFSCQTSMLYNYGYQTRLRFDGNHLLGIYRAQYYFWDRFLHRTSKKKDNVGKSCSMHYLSAKLMMEEMIFAQFSSFFRSPSLSRTAPYSFNTKCPRRSGIFASETISTT